jgi:competence protein ComEC
MRLAFWAAAYVGGIALSLLHSQSAFWLGGVGILLALYFGWLRAWQLTVCVLCFAFGGIYGAYAISLAFAPATISETVLVPVVGKVVRGPEVDRPPPAYDQNENIAGATSQRFLLRIRTFSIGDQRIEGDLQVRTLSGIPRCAPGDLVAFSSRLVIPRGFANPGLPNSRLASAAKGMNWVCTLGSALEIKPLEVGQGWLPRRIAHFLRLALSRSIDRVLPLKHASFVRIMVLGERNSVGERLEEGFRAAGATHALSVSGLHLAVVVSLVFLLFRWGVSCIAWFALRFPPDRVAALLSLPLVWLYTFMTGEAVATVRSAWMATILLGGTLLGRPSSLAASMAFAALVMLVGNPLLFVDVSFQLSFVSVMALGLFAHMFLDDPSGQSPGIQHRIWRWLKGSLSATFAASLVTAPLVAHHFGEFTPAAPAGNLLLVPLVELVVLPCGLFGAILGLIHPWLAFIPLKLAGLGAGLSLLIAEGFRVIAPVLHIRRPNVFEMLGLLLAAGALLWGIRKSGQARMRWWKACGFMLAIAIGSLVVRDLQRRWSRDFSITFLDVGQGDAALVESPGGFVALVDGGGRYDQSFDTGARIIEPVLRARGINHLDLVVLSHPHPDHLNGLFRILERFQVDAIWTNGDRGGNPKYDDFVRLAARHGIPILAPVQTVHGPLTIQVLGPWLDGNIAAPPELGTNDASLVLRLVFAGKAILLPGDIAEAGEFELLGQSDLGAILASLVLKVPHHGSRYSSGEAFIDGVQPTLAVVSAGRFNSFGLPHPQAMARYTRRGIAILRTDQHGAINIRILPDGTVHATCMSDCR